MANVNVYFLGEEYSFPEELKELAGYEKYFANILDNILGLVLDQVDNKAFTGAADEDFIYFEKPLASVGRKVISDLATKNVFDVTLNEIVYENKGYLQLHEVCANTMQRQVEILLSAMDDWSEQSTGAYNAAASNITGSGVSVWTNSLSVALMHSVLEASTLNKQINEAGAKYQADLKRLSSDIDNRMENQKMELLGGYYYPNVVLALGSFVSEMKEIFLVKLQYHGLFKYDKVKNYDMGRASQMVENISFLSNKASVIKEAFVCCPFNSKVFSAAIVNGLADFSTYETAKYLLLDDLLTDVIQEYVENNIDDIDRIRIPVKALALYKSEDEKTIWKDLFSKEYESLCKYYRNLNTMLSNKSPSSIIRWVYNHITKDAAELSEMDENTLKKKVNKALSHKVVKEKCYTVFYEMNMLDSAFIFAPPATLNELNTEYAMAIFKSVCELLPSVRTHVEKYKKAISVSKKKYKNAMQEYEREFKALVEKKKELCQQLEKLRFFEFSEKKDLTMKIQDCEFSIELLKEHNNVNSLKKEYDRLNNKMNLSLIEDDAAYNAEDKESDSTKAGNAADNDMVEKIDLVNEPATSLEDDTVVENPDVASKNSSFRKKLIMLLVIIIAIVCVLAIVMGSVRRQKTSELVDADTDVLEAAAIMYNQLKGYALDGDEDSFAAMFSDADDDYEDYYEQEFPEESDGVNVVQIIEEDDYYYIGITDYTVDGEFPDSTVTSNSYDMVMTVENDHWTFVVDEDIDGVIYTTDQVPTEMGEAAADGLNYGWYDSTNFMYLDEDSVYKGAAYSSIKFVWQNEDGSVVMILWLVNGSESEVCFEEAPVITLFDDELGTIINLSGYTINKTVDAMSRKLVKITIDADDVLTGTEAWSGNLSATIPIEFSTEADASADDEDDDSSAEVD